MTWNPLRGFRIKKSPPVKSMFRAFSRWKAKATIDARIRRTRTRYRIFPRKSKFFDLIRCNMEMRLIALKALAPAEDVSGDQQRRKHGRNDADRQCYGKPFDRTRTSQKRIPAVINVVTFASKIALNALRYAPSMAAFRFFPGSSSSATAHKSARSSRPPFRWSG